jgi:hypothetical protein
MADRRGPRPNLRQARRARSHRHRSRAKATANSGSILSRPSSEVCLVHHPEHALRTPLEASDGVRAIGPSRADPRLAADRAEQPPGGDRIDVDDSQSRTLAVMTFWQSTENVGNTGAISSVLLA